MGRSQSREYIEKELSRRIKSGQFVLGQRLPSERELADEYGVSRSTIQGAFASLATRGIIVHKPHCRPVVTGLTFPSKGKVVVAKNRIAVWIQPDLQDLGAAMILQGIRTATESSGFPLLIGFPQTHRTEEEHRSEVQFLKSLVEHPDVAGAIVWETCAPAFPTVFPALHDVGIPVVFVNREPPEQIEADVVSTNNRRGALKAVSHLLRLGHRHIAMIRNDEPASSVRDRIEGYRDALRGAETAIRPEFLVELEIEALASDPKTLVESLRSLLTLTPSPTALFCVNDGIALSVQDALHQFGLRAPNDISLVGFDWILRSLPNGGDLTTVAQPFEAIGRIAAERLLERINNNLPEPPRHILLEAPLVVKSTTGPPPTSSANLRNAIMSR